MSCFIWQKCSVMHILQKVTSHWAKIRGAAGISCLELICHYMLLIHSQLVDLEGGAVSFFMRRHNLKNHRDTLKIEIYWKLMILHWWKSLFFHYFLFEKLGFNKRNIKIWQCCFKLRSRESNIFYVNHFYCPTNALNYTKLRGYNLRCIKV